MTDEEVFTYARTMSSATFRKVAKALKDATIPHRSKVASKNRFWQPGDDITVFVKPDRAARLDKFVERFK